MSNLFLVWQWFLRQIGRVNCIVNVFGCLFHFFPFFQLNLYDCFLWIRRGQTEKSSITRDFPVAKAAYSFLKDTVSSSFCFPGWNKGRIVCQKTQLKRIFSSAEPSSGSSKGDRLIPLSNSPISLLGTQTSVSDAKRSESANADSKRSTKSDSQLMASSV